MVASLSLSKANLFQNLPSSMPLAERLRPKTLAHVIGQNHILGKTGAIGLMLSSAKLASLILWGGPGCGKTTIARLLAHEFNMEYMELSAIFSGVGELRKCFDQAKILKEQGRQSLLFIDEIHRFNKSQQDAFLPVVEDGTVILVGATTQNPSFELNGALLSRCQVLVLNPLSLDDLLLLVKRAEDHLQFNLPLTSSARDLLVELADRDGRYLLSMIEMIASINPKDIKGLSGNQTSILDDQDLIKILQKRRPLYDKGDDQHYNLISALHKSLRGSDVDAGLYWLARMLEGGEDPLYIARRLMRFAYEDIGMADPQAAVQAEMATKCYERLGSPEGEIALAQLVIYLATAPKSNSVYVAIKSAKRHAKQFGSLMPPKHILNAPTELMKKQGYGDGYQYDPDQKDGFSGQSYFPDDVERQNFYQPKGWGFEKEINQRLAYWHNLRQNKQKS